MIHGSDTETIRRAMATMEAGVLGITTTTSTVPAPTLTLEKLQAMLREMDPDGRIMAEAALLAKLRKRPVSWTKMLSKLVPEA